MPSSFPKYSNGNGCVIATPHPPQSSQKSHEIRQSSEGAAGGDICQNSYPPIWSHESATFTLMALNKIKYINNDIVRLINGQIQHVLISAGQIIFTIICRDGWEKGKTIWESGQESSPIHIQFGSSPPLIVCESATMVPQNLHGWFKKSCLDPFKMVKELGGGK